MQIVREYINEKFTEDSDPIHDMSIGLYAKRNFHTEEEFLQFMKSTIPIILKVHEIPKDILGKDDWINRKYFNALNIFLEKYVSYKNISLKSNRCKIYCWNDIVSHYLRKNKTLK